MGCRYCMVSCPFNIPKFEYDEWNPKIHKCDMCAERVSRGEKPACVEACPTDALMFGMKRDLMEVARVRIYNHPPKRYVRKIYGEHEVGGTGWLYLSAVPFEQLGFRTDLGTIPYPEYTRDFLYGVPGGAVRVTRAAVRPASAAGRKKKRSEAAPGKARFWGADACGSELKAFVRFHARRAESREASGSRRST